MSLCSRDSRTGSRGSEAGVVWSAITKFWMCLRRASSFPATPSSSRPAQLLAPTPFLFPPALRICQLQKFLPLPFHPSENCGLAGDQHSPYRKLLLWRMLWSAGPLPRPWPLSLGWNSILALGLSHSHTPSPEVLMHQVESVKVSWMPAGARLHARL